MITPDGWLDWAERRPGPAEKQYSQPNRIAGYIPHSMVGRLEGWYSRLFDLSRLPDGRFTPNAAASVHGSILLRGHVIQHYPFTVSCWASGSRTANTRFIAFENESAYVGGQPDETVPFTADQVRANIIIIRELAAWRGWELRRPRDESDLEATLYEHREMTRFGAAATACPSERAAPLWAELEKEEEDMPDAELRAAIRVAALFIHARSDVEQFGRLADPNVRASLAFVLGGLTPNQPPRDRAQALGVLLYGAAQAQQMQALGEEAKRVVRHLAGGGTVPG